LIFAPSSELQRRPGYLQTVLGQQPEPNPISDLVIFLKAIRIHAAVLFSLNSAQRTVAGAALHIVFHCALQIHRISPLQESDFHLPCKAIYNASFGDRFDRARTSSQVEMWL
jgi:hypothetical protein